MLAAAIQIDRHTRQPLRILSKMAREENEKLFSSARDNTARKQSIGCNNSIRDGAMTGCKIGRVWKEIGPAGEIDNNSVQASRR